MHDIVSRRGRANPPGVSAVPRPAPPARVHAWGAQWPTPSGPLRLRPSPAPGQHATGSTAVSREAWPLANCAPAAVVSRRPREHHQVPPLPPGTPAGAMRNAGARRGSACASSATVRTSPRARGAAREGCPRQKHARPRARPLHMWRDPTVCTRGLRMKHGLAHRPSAPCRRPCLGWAPTRAIGPQWPPMSQRAHVYDAQELLRQAWPALRLAAPPSPSRNAGPAQRQRPTARTHRLCENCWAYWAAGCVCDGLRRSVGLPATYAPARGVVLHSAVNHQTPGSRGHLQVKCLRHKRRRTIWGMSNWNTNWVNTRLHLHE